MNKNKQAIAFSYFTSPKYLVNKAVNTWLPKLRHLGASAVIFKSGFSRAISEDVFIAAQENELMPIIHFVSELPLARKFNEVAFLLDIYAKWGIGKAILGDKPNIKKSWQISGWHYENLVDHFLDRFIPLANHAVRIGLQPVFPPLQPGGDYWDSAFIELALEGLRRRRMDSILANLALTSYGYTFNKPLIWGRGGPERWSSSKPYQTPEGQEDQLGFHNFEWVQAISQRVIGEKLPILILDAGCPGTLHSELDPDVICESIKKVYQACIDVPSIKAEEVDETVNFGDSVHYCTFELDTLDRALGGGITFEQLKLFFVGQNGEKINGTSNSSTNKVFSDYLLLPSYDSGVSDAILNKVRPLIKQKQPTVGFSLKEASLARNVLVYPDPNLFPDDEINRLRTEGCVVTILPESGIEIATISQNI